MSRLQRIAAQGGMAPAESADFTIWSPEAPMTPLRSTATMRCDSGGRASGQQLPLCAQALGAHVSPGMRARTASQTISMPLVGKARESEMSTSTDTKTSSKGIMNHRLLLASLAKISRQVRLMAAIAVVAVLALAATALLASPASAASTTPGDFSSIIPNNPSTYWVDDCWVEVGVVYDWWSPNYRRIGGVRVTCLSRHNVIDATVALFYYYGGRWVQWGNGTYDVRYNVAGLDDRVLYGIVETPATCVGAYKAYPWIVGATVRTERVGRTVWSPQAQSGTGC